MAASVGNQSTPSSYKLKQPSPLESLARRTSNRRANNIQNQHPLPTQQISSPQPYHHPSPRIIPLKDHSAEGAPHSPLLHGHFSRGSTATTTTFATFDNRSYLDLTPEDDESYYEESVYSFSDPALRDSWTSPNTVQRPDTGGRNPDSAPTTNDAYDGMTYTTPYNAVPAVVISVADSDQSSPSRASGKAPITGPRPTNFSRPVRPSAAGTPPLPPEDEKRRVLERNASRSPGQHSYTPRHSSPLQSNTAYFDGDHTDGRDLRAPSPNSGQPYAFPSRSASPASNSTYRHNLTPSPAPLSPATPSTVYSANDSLASTDNQSNMTSLPRRPPSLRPSSPVSVYSKYSFYQLDSASPSPTSPSYPSNVQQMNPNSRSQQHLPVVASKLKPTASEQSQSMALEYLQLGIQHHEANRLRESAECFEKSAKEGGCGVGMLMWGLALRHGWGCEKNEKVGFKWLSKAAECAVEDLESLRGGAGVDSKLVQNELVLAIYEVGQCFFQGWGVQKDQKMAFSYYSVAAKLGDADAQSDLGYCLANGKGCKKDRKEAAKWYREAVKQGVSDIGLAWIYKEKYQ